MRLSLIIHGRNLDYLDTTKFSVPDRKVGKNAFWRMMLQQALGPSLDINDIKESVWSLVTKSNIDSNTYNRTSNGQVEKNVPKWSWTKVKQPSLKQRKKLVALTLTKKIELTLSNHLYGRHTRINTWRGKR